MCFRITDVEPKAVKSTAARVEVVGNEISNFHSSGFIFNNWNKIVINDNIIKHLHANFVEARINADMERFSFKGNEIYNIDEGALSFLANIPEEVLVFDDNFFNESCGCNMTMWLQGITSTTKRTKVAMDTSFCIINEFLSKCFSLPQGIINIQNFTEKTCSNFTKCEPYEGKTRVVNTTRLHFASENETDQQKWFIVIIALVGFLLLTIMASFLILLLKDTRLLKDKCFFRNVQYTNDEFAIEEEGTVVTVDENEKLQLPDELTLEFLQILSNRLDDPVTHQEASEMIERLYEMFIIDDSNESNNRDEEEAHLYEELGNLNLEIPPPPYEEDKEQTSRSILKLMEEKINLNADEQVSNTKRPTLVSDYSEPTDAAIHLYSEIKNKAGKESQKLTNSNGYLMQGINTRYISEPGPSTKL